MERADLSPLIIIGCPRSGTTLFRLMLTCHEQIVIPPESGFLLSLYDRHKHVSGTAEEIGAFAQDVMKSSKFDTWDIPFDRLLNDLMGRRPASYPEFVAAVYRCYGEIHQPGKIWWGDKNNYFLHNIETIDSLFPQARFLHIIRDGRDVACSFRDLGLVTGKHAPKLPNSAYGAAAYWQGALHAIRKSFDKIGWQKVHELHYEDLVLQPDATLKAVCEFIGVSYSPSMIQFHRFNKEKNLEPESFSAWKGRTRNELTSSRTNRWRTEMFAEDVLIFESIAHRGLRAYGYPLSTSESSKKLELIGIGIRLFCRAQKVLCAKTLNKLVQKLKERVSRIFFNSRLYARLTGKTHVLCLGDSHISVFDEIKKQGMAKNLRFDVLPVPAATAQGGANPNSKTNALKIFRKRLSQAKPFQTVLLLLGEVDTGFVIWYYAEKYGISVDAQLRRSIENYASFIKEVNQCGFHRVIVMSAPLPTIVDGQDWGEIANLRKEVKATQLERTQMTQKFNRAIKAFCRQTGVGYLDLDRYLIDESTGLIKDTYRNPYFAEHHLNPHAYAQVILNNLN